MTFPNDNFPQIATYWAMTGPDGHGWFTFSSPVQIDVRWIDKQDQILDKDGKEIISDAVVYMEEDLVISGFLYLGTSAQADPKNQSGSAEIKRIKKTPSLDGSVFRRKVWLKR